MKKMLSLSLVLLFILGVIPLPKASAAVVDGSLIFNMDISNYDAASVAASKGITNSISGNHTTSIAVPGNPTLKTVAGIGTKYLTINEKNAPGSNNGVKVLDTAVNSATSLSIEMWARNKLETIGTKSPMFFLLTKGAGFHSMQCVTVNAGTLNYRPFDNIANKYFNNTQKDNWAHYVFTRTFTPAGCTWSVFVNGVSVTSGVDAGKTMMNQTDYYMHIGGGTYATHTPFEGDIATFKIYNSVMTVAEAKEKYDNEVVYYTELPNTMNFVSATPAGGSILQPSGGAINLKFDNIADSSTLSAISLVDAATGLPVPGGIQTSVKASTKEIIVQYGSIEANKNYNLIISNNLKSLNNIAYAGSQIPFQTASNVIINEDFSGSQFVEGNIAPTGNGLTYMYSTAEANPQNNEMRGFEIKSASANGGVTDKYLSIGSDSITAPGWSRAVQVVLPQALTEGALVAEIEARPSSVNGDYVFGRGATREVFRMFNGAATNGMNLPMSKYGTITGSGFDNTFTTSLNKRNAFGFYRLKIVAQKDKTTGYYYIEAFSPDDILIKGRKSIQQPKITAVELAHIYTAATEHLDDRTDISAVKVYTATSPKVTSLGQYDYRQKIMEFVLNDDLDATTLTANSVVVKKGETQVALLDVPVYDPQNRKLTVRFVNRPVSGESYTLSFNGVFSQNGVPFNESFDFVPVSETVDLDGAVTFIDQNNVPTSVLEGVTDITASFTLKNNTNITQTLKTIIVLYNGNKMERCEAVSSDILSGAQEPISIELAGITPTENSVIKIFVWSDLENMIPVLDNDIALPYRL